MFDGQSFNNYPQAVASDKPYTVRLLELLKTGTTTFGSSNQAISGTSYTDRNSTVVSRVDQFGTRYETLVICDFSGVKDISEGKTPAQILALAEAYADARRVAGFDYILTATVTKNTGYTAGQETTRQQYNNLLRANANNKFDAILDIDSLAHAQNPANTTYFTDGIHPSNALAAEFADLVYQHFLALDLTS